jgi:transposase
MRESERLAFWTKVLRLEGFEVVHCEEDAPGHLRRFTVIPTLPVAVCPHCGTACAEVHQRRTRERSKDLPMGTETVELTVRVLQFWCAPCQQAFTPPSAALAEGARATERFLQRAAALIRASDIANVAAFLGVPEKTLEKWYYDYVERQHQTPATVPKPIRALGIDELSLKKSTGNSSPS